MVNRKEWDERKKELQRIFRETRKSGLMFPHDIDDVPDVNGSIESERSNMAYIRHSIEDYIKTQLNFENFDIIIEYDASMKHHFPLKEHHLPFRVTRRGERGVVVTHNATNRIERQIALVEAFSLIALVYPAKINETSPIFGDDIIYLTQKILETYATFNNGAVLRSEYVISADMVLGEIQKIHPDYNPDKAQKEKVNNLLPDIFLGYPNVNENALDCERKRILSFIKEEKYSDLLKYPDIGSFNIIVKPKAFGKDEPRGRSSVSHDEINRKITGIIFHQAKEELEAFLSAPKHGTDKLVITSKHAQNIVRLIIAHEISHIALEYEYGATMKGQTQESERDAFYFARLILEHREFLYFPDKESKEYRNACKLWKELIIYVYKKQPNFEQKYLDWVIED